MKLTFKRLNEVLRYEPGTGRLRWKVRMAQNAQVDYIAGSINGDGYIQITIDGKSYKAHRLAYMIYHGTMLVDEVDHEDGVRTNNVITNLREADDYQNKRNEKLRKTNTSGVKGVSWDSSHNTWKCQINFEGKVLNLGRFHDIEDAKIAIRKHREKLHGEFCNHG